MTTRTNQRPVTLTLRSVTAEDEAFLYELYASTRAAEMALTGWDEAEQERFIRMQFRAQQQHYQRAFPEAQHDIILQGKKRVGRLYVNRPGSEIRLVDITLAPPYRNQGIGSYFMKQLKAEAMATNIPIRFYVWQQNTAAQRFYERHGCEQIKPAGAYIFMGWHPSGDIRQFVEDR